MRNDRCRVSVLDVQQRSVGCGFVVDTGHIMTCVHVVASALGREPVLGDRIVIRSNAGDELTVIVRKLGGPGFDVSVLERVDGRFMLGDCALWAPGLPGDQFYGLGMNKDYPDGIPLAGRLNAATMGGRMQLVTAEQADNRVEQGSSGAGIFRLKSSATGDTLTDGPLVGMVTNYQQDRTGLIVTAAALAEFWPDFRSFDPEPGDAFPSLMLQSIDPAVVGQMVRGIDRVPQKLALGRALRNAAVLSDDGFFVATIVGCRDDLPDECAKSLCTTAFARIMQSVAPDTIKLRTESQKLSSILADKPEDACFNLLEMLGLRFNVWGDVDQLRARMKAEMVPLSIIVTATAEDISALSEDILSAWADCLKDLSFPELHLPIAMFILVTGEESDSVDLPEVSERWYVRLDRLGALDTADVEQWTLSYLPDDADGRQLREQIESVVAERSAAQAFRLKHLKTWLSTEQ